MNSEKNIFGRSKKLTYFFTRNVPYIYALQDLELDYAFSIDKIPHFVLIRLVLVVIAAHHVDVVIPLIGHRAEPCQVKEEKLMRKEEKGKKGKQGKPVILVRVACHSLPTLLLVASCISNQF